ncbi:MAG: ThuA domain-containing protein [Gammaproteobacteria bacterium]
MHRLGKHWKVTKIVLLATAASFVQSASAGDGQRILLFTKTAGFTHGSINAAVPAIRSRAEQEGFIVDDTDDADVFTAANLANYDAVVFVMTTGNILNEAQQLAFEGFIQAGNGFAGIHSASDTEYDWPWYGDLVGAYFSNHPSIQEATVNIEDSNHPSTQGISNPWIRTDEWYNFQDNPRNEVNVLATVDESTYNGGNMGSDHPIAWYHEYDGGRSWYTAGGHRSANYNEPEFVDHLMGGISYAAGMAQLDDTDTDGIDDASDNCTATANADQLDTDSDGFGNACDADLNNDCATNFLDFSLLADAFQTTDVIADLNADGIVNFSDIFLFTQLNLTVPGPSALASCE